MRKLVIDNYTFDAPIIDILNRLRLTLTNGKLGDIKVNKDDILVTCPHHSNGQEAKPACNIYTGEDNRIPYGYFRCFVCNEKGDFLHFAAECLNSSEDFALNWLLTNFEHTEERHIQLDDDVCLNKPKRRYLDKNILNSPNFQSYCPYLAERGVSREVAELFQVKYDSQYKQIVFPCFDTKNNLIMMPTRSINRKIFYIDRNKQKPVYGLNIIKERGIRRFLIVEGPFDMLVCWSHNVPAVALFGQPAWNQIKDISTASPIEVLIATDNDFAGQEIANTVIGKLAKNILSERINPAANRKDVAEMNEEEWQEFIKKYNLPKVKI